jgi:P27 family predicted phage terminase small subunit
MPTNVVNLDNMRKHMTNAEKSARNLAENQIQRNGKVNLREPKNVKEDPAAHAHWMEIKRKLKGINLLDDVDSDMLGIYCQLLVRRDLLQKMLRGESEEGLKMVRGDLLTALQAQERLVAQYAEKLGLTPGGRARLAKREAEKPKENKFSKFQK